MSESESDKKRNKLGYQRISVACAHCRRRKIRCVMAEGDPQNRCQNCIRLNKECIFHPVEQQQGTSDSGSVAGQQNTPISYSPRDFTAAAGQPFDTRSNNFTHLAPLPSSSVPHIHTGVPYDAHPAQNTPHSAVIDYHSQHFGDARWSVREGAGASMHIQPQAPTGEAVESNQLYWHTNLGGANHPLPPDARSYSFPNAQSTEQWQVMQHQQQQQPSRATYSPYERQEQYSPHQGMTGAAIQQSVPHAATFPINTHSVSTMGAGHGSPSTPLNSGNNASEYQQTAQQYAFQNPQFHSQQDMSGSWLGSHEQPDYGGYGLGHMEDNDPTDNSRRG